MEAMREAVGENTTQPQCTTYSDTDYYQPGGSGITTYNTDQCCMLCYQDDLCNYWTFYQGQCYLKATNDGKTSSSGRISGDCQNSANADNSSKIIFELGCIDVPCKEYSLDPVSQLLTSNMDDLDMVMVLFGLDQSIESEGHDR